MPDSRKVADKPSSVEQAGLPPELAERLRHLATLKDGWDDDSLGITRRAVRRAAAILQQAQAVLGYDAGTPFIAPSPDGGLSLEWKVRGGDVLLIDVQPDARPERFFIWRRSDKEETRNGVIADAKSLQEVLRLKA